MIPHLTFKTPEVTGNVPELIKQKSFQKYIISQGVATIIIVVKSNIFRSNWQD